MNRLTGKLLRRARALLKGQRVKLTPEALEDRLWHCFRVWQHNSMERRGCRLLVTIPQKRLRVLAPIVFDLLWESGHWYGIERPENQQEELWCAALGLAVLWWLNREAKGLTPKLRYTKGEIAEWLAKTETYQLRMF